MLETLKDVIEILKIAANWGFPAFFCVLWYFDLRKKTMSLDKTSGFLDKTVGSLVVKVDSLEKIIGNDLVHALERNTEITKKDAESSEKVEKAMDNLSNKIIGFIERDK